MADPVNLNRYRKLKARAERQVRGERNAARFGQTGAQKDLARARADKARRDLDGHKADGKGKE